jgi:TonB family protein
MQQPKYTGDAMRAKVQGTVELEAVVLPNGTVGDIRIVRSLDRITGLDDEAIRAARAWFFAPGRDAAGRPIPVFVTLILEFRIH